MLKIVSALGCMVILGLALTHFAQVPDSAEGCEHDMHSTPASMTNGSCQKTVNWRAWASGKSRSTQFHFLDLLELTLGQRDRQPQRPPTTH
ncbi:hypothetical protein [Aliidiomarina sanyensis]|uniref:Uncharacterized protein n=1 Tax=Aliidiomarina sanyensis TaxID=1249555 RepID=A0A432WKE8_9GAMM|nr:hypothetical protein [Aliidiomarina sanyensis]RUO34167.1 hypothetical protein CWE11_05415 [Aliidiomarina sanyensis]